MLNNKKILITGGTGSFGKKFLEVVLKKYNIKKILIFSRDEQKQFQIKNKYKKYEKKIRYLLGDVRDYSRLNFAMKDVDMVIHAAALKHVEIGEYNPFEVVQTNILGAQNVIRCALDNKVDKVIALSTDKASSPINLYGATKLTSDKLFVAANYYGGKNSTKFSVVRYGNVMGSRGSIIPLLLKHQVDRHFSVTDIEMTRFNITLENSVKFVLNSLNFMWGGEIFVPKLKSYKLIDLVKVIIPKTPINLVGSRSGEKLHEEMISTHDSVNTVEFRDFYVICPNSRYLNWAVKDYLKRSNKSKLNKKEFSYNSRENIFLSPLELKKLIQKNINDFDTL
jgi:UDP-N-acetylglucosamine 4,6-dehydratase